MTNDPQSWIATMKKMKLTLAIKILLVIWLSSFLVNMASSSSGLYSIGTIGFKHFVNSINRSSGELMAVSGLLLYPIVLLWSVLNYQKIRGYVLEFLASLITRWKIRKKINDSRAKQELQKESTAKEIVGYFSLFLVGMLLIDTFLYSLFTSQFRGDTEAQAMPKRVMFILMLSMIHQLRPIFWIALSISTLLYTLLFLVELFKGLKRKG